MNIREFQEILNEKGAGLTVDGVAGPATRAAIIRVFTNCDAPAVTPVEIAAFAKEIGCSEKQIRAVAKVESAGGGFTHSGLPKILFERHYFWRFTDGKFGETVFSNPHGGGYDFDSWEKLTLAACKDPHSAFASASWGKFQIMGSHWHDLGYANALAFAYSFTRSEAAHYEALVRFIKANNLTAAIKALSTRPSDCVEFARRYNGKGYRQNRYDEKLAEAMR